ncbi:uncharacterized protein N7511_008880 [Penicillium nucicola]|uniref:uncharacterized protein n=1 Tax=Penicillium nucicola TaxID=1850975 RepID=UPI002545150E|nr:uncharacterized protein N7511_008880 [Penicillium nucicola]KAJ5747184.1 hypothetical protein N7511_008880 [Penicillium nucicola]
MNIQPKQFVLCFDGTGNKFAGDASDTNLVKIYRMLDRSKSHQYHYYQPGIGTYVTSNNFGGKSRLERVKSSYKKAKDAALGSSFDEHVLGGYKFLMRYYAPGDKIYFFGFSRGSYTARFLAEMLDFVGLLQPGNEEMIRFAWKTFAKWQQRRDTTDHDHEERHRLFMFMKAFRETFSRPVGRIQFLGLFDTVNSVPVFENAWMERSKFPYTAQSSARVIRHAVSIDERRAKFRQDLLYEVRPKGSKEKHSPSLGLRRLLSRQNEESEKVNVPEIVLDRPENERQTAQIPRRGSLRVLNEGQRYRGHSHSPNRRASVEGPRTGNLLGDDVSQRSGVSGLSLRPSHLNVSSDTGDDDDEQDVAEVWFPGQHGDVGGGWILNPKDPWPLSHIPLVWMVKEAQLAGLEFDPEKLEQFNCRDEAIESHRSLEDTKPNIYRDALQQTMDQGIVHDTLTYGGGVSALSTLSWRLMEYLPFRRMDLQSDGSWKPIRWPLPCGEVRDIPEDAQIHISAIHRMEIDPKYRPGNLIIGGGGRGVKRAPPRYGIGNWQVCKNEGDLVRQTYVRKIEDLCQDDHL